MIRDVQRLLKGLGYDPGPLDGKSGPRTSAALSDALKRYAPMPAVPVVPDAAIALIKEFEGFRGDAYRDPVGIWTIGYGTTAAAGIGVVPREGMGITEWQATEYLRMTVAKFAAEIAPMLTREATPHEFGAMVSLAYNIGPDAFRRSSVLRQFNLGHREAAGDAFRLWNKAGSRVLRGLVRRREAERAMFLGQ
jgi:lysozyme